MSNSKLVNYTKISPNSSSRKHPITKVTIHHVAGNLSVETIGNVFAPASRGASSNYGIDSNGRVGMYVEEKNRAWTSGNADNDHRAVTIEVSNSKIGGQWPVSDKALAKLIELVADICKRNGIKTLNYTGNKNGNLTRHNMFQSTVCPGPHLQGKFPYIATEVNKRLNPLKITPTSGDYTVKKGDTLWGIATANKITVETLKKINNLASDTIYPGDKLKLSVDKGEFLVQVTVAALNYRNGPGTSYKVNGVIRDRGVYTITEQKNGWGKLKSGSGWISLSYAKKI